MGEREHRFWGLGLHWAWVPMFGFIFGIATIISLLVIWLADGAPHYRPSNPTVVYISDVGAANHALFIVLGTLTAICFFGSLFYDFMLRHTHRISGRQRNYERFATAMAVIFGFISAVCCILLTIFDAFHHSTLHWTFAAIFFIALLISGGFNTIEITGLARDYKVDKLIRASFVTKVLIEVIGVGCVIAIGILQGVCSEGTNTVSPCDSQDSGAAILEWIVALLFAFYILSMCLDLYPSRYTSRHSRRRAPAGSADVAPSSADGAGRNGDVVAAASMNMTSSWPPEKYVNTDQLELTNTERFEPV